MTYRVGVSLHADRVEGIAFDLPGCSVSAPDETTLHGVSPIAIAEHVAWLAGHGEPVDVHAAIDIDVVDTITRAETTAADGEFCFEDDLRPVTYDEIEAAVRHMGHARADLLSLVEPLPDAVLDWRPPRSAMRKIDPWNPDVLTIREIVAEIGNSDGYYRTGLQDGAPSSADQESEGLEAQRQRVIARLRSLSADERRRLFHPVRPWRESPEDWTARKAVRRIIGHERFHTKEIEQRLAWLLLGVPDFTRVGISRQPSLTSP